MTEAIDQVELQRQQEIAQKQQLVAENQRLQQQLQETRQVVATLKQRVARLAQENQSLQKQLTRAKKNPDQGQPPAQSVRGMKSLAKQLEAYDSSAPAAEQPPRGNEPSATTASNLAAEPERLDGERLMRAYFGDRQDFSKKARGR